MDTTNPAVRQQFAWALTVLGLSYAQTEQPQEAVEAGKEAVRIYQDLSGSNPALLPLLSGALDSLSDHYREAGQDSEINAQWEAAVASQERPRDKAYLLLRRAEGREPGDTAAVNDLLEAKAYLTNVEDRDRTADLHQVCRLLRAANPPGFDAAWQSAGGGELPQWLTLDSSYLALIGEWVTKEPLEAARDFLREHIGALSPEPTSVALDEIALIRGDPFAIEPYRELLQWARELGVDEAYRPTFAMKLLYDWMSSDVATTRTMLVERREELLGNAVEKAMQALLADNPGNPQFIAHKALLDLARTGKQDLAFQVIEDPARTSATLLDLARAGDVDALDAVATLVFLTGGTELVRALSCFYKAIALALRDQPDQALEAVSEARRLDPTQVPTWLAVLVELASKQYDELIPLSKALIAPPPPKAAGVQ
jgi:tetratricopeptide (TPR) repeat protein